MSAATKTEVPKNCHTCKKPIKGLAVFRVPTVVMESLFGAKVTAYHRRCHKRMFPGEQVG